MCLSSGAEATKAAGLALRVLDEGEGSNVIAIAKLLVDVLEPLQAVVHEELAACS